MQQELTISRRISTEPDLAKIFSIEPSQQYAGRLPGRTPSRDYSGHGSLGRGLAERPGHVRAVKVGYASSAC
jgi:hypothetical protein